MFKRLGSGIILTLLLVCMLTSAFNVQPVKATGTIYIRADGSIDPPTANITSADNVTYHFFDNNYDEIVVERSNIIMDGNGYMLKGSGTGIGFNLTSISNVTIQDTNISNFKYGIRASQSDNNTLSDNIIANNTQYGVVLYSSSDYNNVSGNNIANNNLSGIVLSAFSSYNKISGNTLKNNTSGVNLAQALYNNVSGNNFIDNIPDGATVILSHYNIFSGNNITNSHRGIFLSRSTHNTVSGNNITNNDNGVYLYWGSSYNTVSGNNISDSDYGVYLNIACSYNIASENNITNNNLYGIYIYDTSENNTISGNNIINSTYSGVLLTVRSDNNTISGNNITNNAGVSAGISLYMFSSLNTISGNTITESANGIILSSSSDNEFYHNNFISNTQQVFVTPGYANIWNNSYPSGGNYWSDYTGVDLYSGPYQDETGSDGIGDTPHVFDADNQDNYPHMNKHGWTPGTPMLVPVDGGADNVIVESNGTVTHAVATRNTLHFEITGPLGQTACVNVTMPVGLNETAITVYIDGAELPPPFPTITSNGTHYFVYFEVTLSTHSITIQYAITDIATTSVTPSKTVVGQGFTLTINATIQNQGNYTETFNMTAYANTTIIATLTNITLTSGTSTILTFLWNTSGVSKGNYTINAYAWPVLGETDTSDNNFTDGWVIVAMVGDITGPDGWPDGKVDIRDIALVANKFGAVYPDPRYDANCDLTGPITGVADGKIDIRDIALIAIHYGEV